MRDLIERTFDAIDRVNADDPNLIDGEPLAMVQGQRATHWLAQLGIEPSTELEVAARAHHVERWKLARTDYPDGRSGYLRWRRDNKAHQAARGVELCAESGLVIDAERLTALLLRRELQTDPETQALEDVACIVFVETQFEPVVDRLGHDKSVDVVAKTLRKMSVDAIALAAGLELTPDTHAVLIAAVERVGHREPDELAEPADGAAIAKAVPGD